MSNKKSKPILDGLDVQVELEEAIQSEELSEDVVEAIIEDAVVETIVKAGTYVAVEGDTYASLGKRFVKSGETPFQAANRISGLNGGKALKAGIVVTL